LAYERQAWTDDQLNECPPPSEYTLPSTEKATTTWRWLKDSEWHVEGALTEKEKSAKRVGGGGGGDHNGWVYYDNKWDDGRKEDGWGRYTRRRKWVRDAELIEIDPNNNNKPEERDFAAETSSINATPISPAARQRRGWFLTRSASTSNLPTLSPTVTANGTSTPTGTSMPTSTPSKKLPRQAEKNKSVDSVSLSVDSVSLSGVSVASTKSRGSAAEEDVLTPIERVRQYDWDRSIGEGMMEQLS
jgi:hypothetical protein